MNFKHKDFIVIANNSALRDFAPVKQLCVDKNIVHVNTAIHYNHFDKFDNYAAFYSLFKRDFIGMHSALTYNRKFLGVYFMIKENQNTPEHNDTHYNRFQQYPSDNKEYIFIKDEVKQKFLQRTEPSGGFTLVYHLHDNFPQSNIILVGFCGKHKKPEGKTYGLGHRQDLEQVWYNQQPRISQVLNEQPCSPEFHFPCNMCLANNLEEAKTKCLTEDKAKL